MHLLSRLARQPRLALLDSSHLAAWFGDRASEHSANNERAAAFEARMAEEDWLPLLTFHHFEELLQHGSPLLVKRRIRALHALPRLAWIGAIGDHGIRWLGGVPDIMAAETLVAARQPEASLDAIARTAKSILIYVGSGRDLLGDQALKWTILKDAIRDHAVQAREIVAINRSGFANVSHLKIGDLIRRKRVSAEEAASRLEILSARLADDIATRGDRRIEAPQITADALLAEAAALAQATPGGAAELVVGTLVGKGIDPHEIRPELTVGELTDLVVFRQKLMLMAEKLDLPWEQLKARVTPERLPSYLIGTAISQHSQELPEHKGSELNDSYLLAAGLYADRTYVDKRTLENVKRARAKQPLIDDLLGDVARAACYADISLGLARVPPRPVEKHKNKP